MDLDGLYMYQNFIFFGVYYGKMLFWGDNA